VDATVQVWKVDGDRDAFLGDTELVMLWYAPGMSKPTRGSPFKSLVAAGKLTEAQVTALNATLAAYGDSLKSGTWRERDALVDLKTRSEMAKLGIGPEDLTGVRYSASVPMSLYGTRLGTSLPPGWTPRDARDAFARFVTLSRGAEHPTSETMWSIHGHATIAVGTKPEHVHTGDYEDSDPPSAPPPGTALSGYQTAFAAAHAGEIGSR